MASQTTRITSLALVLVLSGTPTVLAVCAAQCLPGVRHRVEHGAQPSSPVPHTTVAVAQHPEALPPDAHHHHAAAAERPDATASGHERASRANRASIALASGSALACCAGGEAPGVVMAIAAARADARALLATAVMAPVVRHTPPYAHAAVEHRTAAGTPPTLVRARLVLRI